MPIGPKKAINILPSRKISVLPGNEGRLLPEGSKFTVYGKKKPQISPSKFAGKTKTGPLGALNRYYEAGGRKVISKVYSTKYRTIPSGENTYAVRIAGEKMYVSGKIYINGELTEVDRMLNEKAIGLMSEYGQLTTLKDFRDSLIAIDNTTVGKEWGKNILTNMWDSLTIKQKVNIIDEFRDFDWAEFWAEMYPHGIKGEANVDRQYEKYDEIKMRIDIALGY